MELIPADKANKTQCIDMITYFLSFPGCTARHGIEIYKKRLKEIKLFEKAFMAKGK
ncbi:MAG: hypothetical protein KJO69_03995 [Gammaproteobacteria bacterium]|nr:hypothetical protein [Gammaproteobacteria bacterium]